MKSASLNHVYRLVWSDTAQAYVAVSEHTSARGKRSGLMGVLAALGLLSAGVAQAASLPTGGTVVGGAGNISQTGNHMVVNQTTNKLVTNWQSFDVGSDASVTFQQPNSSSTALNRVIGGGNASQILGKLNANGQVWLLNPNGVVIGKGAQVNVGGLVASSLKISDEDFLAGKTSLTGGAGAGAVRNEGRITAAQGGVVALIGPQVSNSGVIHTPGGSTALAAGDKVSLDFTGDGLVSVNVDRGVLDAMVQNSGQISADGGMVTLSARSADAAISSVVNNTGIIEAKGMQERNGRIVLDGDDQGGLTQVAGTLDVSSEHGKGGDIVITGEQIALTGAALNASGAQGGGTVKVGGGWQGKDTSVANAHKLSVDAHTTVKADAKDNGDGGTVVLWSDDSNQFAGNISVRGGAQSGNGGKTEVSGKQTLQYAGVTDARAANGVTGDLLLDPAKITVTGGGTASDAIDGSTVTEKALEAQTANVLLQATDSITFADLTLNGGDGTITMQNNVSFRAEAEGGSNAVISFANAANTLEVSGTGSIYMQAGGTATGSISGVFNLAAHGVGDNPAIANLPTHDVTTIGSGTPGAGTITLLGADGLTVAGALTTNGGYVRLSSDSDLGGRGALTINTPISTAGGNLYLSFGTTNYAESIATLNGDITLGSGRLYFGDAMGSKGLGGSTGEKRLGGKLSLSGDVNFTTPLTMLGGASIYTDGDINFTSNVKLDTGTDALTLRATNIDFTQATLQNVSTASLKLEPWDITTNISLDGTDGIATANTFSKLDNIKNLTIGRADGTGTTTVNSSGFAFNANNSLTLLNGDVQIDGALQNTSSTGHVIASAGVGDIQIGSAGGVTGNGTGDAVVLSAARNFINNAGSAALNASNSNGRWLTYSTSPDADTRGGLPLDFKQYNAHYGDAVAQSTGNGQIYTVAPKVTIGLTGEVNKTYDGDTHANVSASNFTATTGAIDGDDVSLIIASYAVANYDDKNVGVGKTVTVNGVSLGEAKNGSVNVYGYQPVSSSISGDIGSIDKKVLTATATVSDKVYDGTTTAQLSNVQLVGVAAGDVGGLGITGTQGSFSDKNAGTDKSVIGVDFSLSGKEVGNYSFDNTAEIGKGNITRKALTGTADVSDKVYDGNTAAILDNIQLVGVLDADANDVHVLGNLGSFSDKNAGTSKSVSGSGIGLGGGEAGNYSFDTGAQIGSATITRKQLTATADVEDKVYDGSTTAALNNIRLVGVLDSDVGNLTTTGNQGDFSDKNVGIGKSVNGSGVSLSGQEAGNYTLDPATQIGKANIDRKILTATADVADKVYDGNTTAALGNVELVGVVDTDVGTVGTTGSQGDFSDKNAGVGKSVTGTGIGLSGEGAGNYSFNTGAEIGTAAITRKTLTATADVSDKVYDGNTAATVGNVQLVGVIDGDVGNLGTTGNQGSFIDKNAGVSKSVSGSGIGLTGVEAGNYSFDADAEIGTAAITRKTLTATADVSDKVYDGSTNATLGNVQLVGVVDSDIANLGTTGNQGSFIDKNAGVGKSVSGSGIGLTGVEANNYSFDTGAQIGTADIARKTLTATADVADKVYDGTTAANVGNIHLVGVVDGDADELQVVGNQGSFADKNAGVGKGVTGTGLGLGGEEAGNYNFDTDAQIGTATIARKTLTATADAANKVYDGTTVASLNNVHLVGVLDSDADSVSVTGNQGSFVDKNAGIGKSVIGSGIGLNGEESGNYRFDTAAQIGTATIARKTLIATADVSDKTYDGNTAAILGNVQLVGVLDSDMGNVGTTGNQGSFSDKNVGIGKSVTGTGIILSGSEAGNYSLDTATKVGNANIDKKTLTAIADVSDKVYDGNTTATLGNVQLVGVIDSDMGNLGTTGNQGSFSDKNAGIGKSVTGSGIGLSGAESGNYRFDNTAEVGTANIDKKTLTAIANVSDKVYDGNTNASLDNIQLVGVVEGDAGELLATGNQGSFSDKNAGVGKSVNGSGIGLSGEEAGNYRFDTAAQVGTATIDKKSLTAEVNVADKSYDGQTTATIRGVTLGGVIDGDNVWAVGSANFLSPGTGRQKPVTISGLQLIGDDFANYQLAGDQLMTTASIDALIYTPVGLLGKTQGANGTATVVNQPQTRPRQGALLYTQPIASSALTASQSRTASGAMDGAGEAPLRGYVLSANGQLSLAIEDGVSSPASKNLLNLYSTRVDAQLQAEGKYSASDTGDSIVLEKVSTTLRDLPMLEHDDSARSEGAVALGSGELLRLHVSMLKGATLLVQAAPTREVISNEELATYGLAVAKQHLGITVDSLRTVVVEQSHGQAVMTDVRGGGVVSR